MADTHPPPTYSQEDSVTVASVPSQSDASLPYGPEILISPTVDALNFQNGYLGAEGERAAIEGEVQIKGIERDEWSKLTISLRTYESAYEQEIELNSNEIVLQTRRAGELFSTTSSFSIPLPPDTPQSIQTPHSSLAHILTAALHPVDSLVPTVSRSIIVYTRRYTSHSHTLPISPETHVLTEPTRVEVQLPRSSFKVGESVPVYLTIPPPSKDIVVDKGLRLRNTRVEMIRDIEVKRKTTNEMDWESEQDLAHYSEECVGTSNNNAGGRDIGLVIPASSAKAPQSASSSTSHKQVIARTGASCRFHSSRPIRFKFILHPPSTLWSPALTQSSLPGNDFAEDGYDADTASITQNTLLHSVTFYLQVYVSFLDTKQQSERTSTLTIPITILPPPARLPQTSQTLDEAYSKKHDRPPAKTNRYDDVDRAVPHYSEGEAGPSMVSNGAPPPFEERDAPPPFSSSAMEASTSTHLPTFLESEREVLLPDSSLTSLEHASTSSFDIEGEGRLFGFRTDDQFDGHSEDVRGVMSPPPSMEMAAGDTDLTVLTELREPSQAIEALNLVLDQHEEALATEENPPPPPPAMDDPSDPPPSIDDSTFRRPDDLEQRSRSRSPPHIHTYHEEAPVLTSPPGLPSPENSQTATPGHAPPPYLNTEVHHDQEHVNRPPPYYMD
ncbi:hypothetical protein AGABI1DRAFT_117237 [Agaricus bisporus var. burnettii JB137-S8]|uniref:Uncharacterized protein n=2 Tax=Agaricus bisporus var. burnettii TaxID=192524 RepID=K5XJQ9_AGABU|nr:uncharacterized protein AGABI1DRAFT_117237 [Agaricus bisporus var. burnettii JB137-S8]EKM83758.1 hypothetical protein AGABI1DRAFT_117237 [Agaricus bisporus var. burnettii JB137-S8]KAF7784442.1 hypothetical protein Agabi119p4_607 [Agaricus bisporus var. burnettii]